MEPSFRTNQRARPARTCERSDASRGPTHPAALAKRRNMHDGERRLRRRSVVKCRQDRPRRRRQPARGRACRSHTLRLPVNRLQDPVSGPGPYHRVRPNRADKAPPIGGYTRRGGLPASACAMSSPTLKPTTAAGLKAPASASPSALSPNDWCAATSRRDRLDVAEGRWLQVIKFAA